MKINTKHLIHALQHTALTAGDRKELLEKVATELQRTARPSAAMRETALLLLDITDVPSETWTDPLPTTAAGALAMGAAVDGLNAAWARTDLHKLVAARRLAWAAAQLARAIEKNLDEVLA